MIETLSFGLQLICVSAICFLALKSDNKEKDSQKNKDKDSNNA